MIWHVNDILRADVVALLLMSLLQGLRNKGAGIGMSRRQRLKCPCLVAVLRVAPVPVLRGADSADHPDADGERARVDGGVARRGVPVPAQVDPQPRNTSLYTSQISKQLWLLRCYFVLDLICGRYGLHRKPRLRLRRGVRSRRALRFLATVASTVSFVASSASLSALLHPLWCFDEVFWRFGERIWCIHYNIAAILKCVFTL